MRVWTSMYAVRHNSRTNKDIEMIVTNLIMKKYPISILYRSGVPLNFQVKIKKWTYGYKQKVSKIVKNIWKPYEYMYTRAPVTSSFCECEASSLSVCTLGPARDTLHGLVTIVTI